jgi:hypothetical protein
VNMVKWFDVPKILIFSGLLVALAAFFVAGDPAPFLDLARFLMASGAIGAAFKYTT